MREILFKAKRKDNGEWVEGWLLKDEVTGQCFIHASGNSVNESDKVNEEGCLRFVAFEVDESTICQYTGLTDKNVRKIWENDIVTEMYRTYVGKIVYNDCGFEVHWIEADIRKDIIFFKAKRGIEVIGNVFDNPELLKGGAE